MLMLYFSVTLSKPKFAKNTLQKHTCSRAAETLGAGEVSNGHIPAQSHLHPQLGWVSQLCSRLACPNLHRASPPCLRGFVAREWGRLVEPELLSPPGWWGCRGCLLHPGCFGSKSWPHHVLMEIISGYVSNRDISVHAQPCSPPCPLLTQRRGR